MHILNKLNTLMSLKILSSNMQLGCHSMQLHTLCFDNQCQVCIYFHFILDIKHIYNKIVNTYIYRTSYLNLVKPHKLCNGCKWRPHILYGLRVYMDKYLYKGWVGMIEDTCKVCHLHTYLTQHHDSQVLRHLISWCHGMVPNI